MTAELAMGLPLLVALTVGLVWLLAVGIAQIRVLDAARETARAVARGDDTGAAVAVGRRVAPAGGEVVVSIEGEQAVAVASGEVTGPGGLFAFLPAVTVRGEAVAVMEENGGGP
ncbi:TadE family type IV pilus minor pilin [Nocardioides nanhaiensis]|uniref:TadE family type IV pilus minor pilin n=1 Tax=Nocardioides nanhaiensis TaxID=1476871 RepID=UPI0031EBB9D2